QPRAGNAIDLRPAPRHPHGAALSITRGHLVGANEYLAGLLPALEAPFQRLRVDALVPEPCGRAFAQLLPALTNDNDHLAAIVGGPACDGAIVAAQRTRQQAWIGAVVVVDADIDDGRRVWHTNKTRELRNGDEGGCRHSVPSRVGSVDAIFWPQPHGVIADNPLAPFMPRAMP